MIKLLTNLKESLVGVIVIILLLCLQAWADLTLPNYTSKIVNIGIQQGGIENSSPEVIRKNQMDNLLLFTDDNKNILSKYTLVSKDNLNEEDYNNYLEEYPAIENEELYVQKDLSDDEQKSLNISMSKPLMILYTLNNEEQQEQIKNQIIENMTSNSSQTMDEMQIQAMQEKIKQQNLIDIIKQMPEVQLHTMLSQVENKINSMSDSILEQAAISEIKEEYKQIGINTDKLQNDYILYAGLQMLGVAFVSMLSAIGIMLLASRIGARLGRTLRDKVFKKVITFSSKEFREFSTASLITRSTNDIQQIQNLIGMMFRTLIYAPIIGIGGFLMVLNNSDTSMAWVIGVALIAILFIMIILFIVAMPKFKKMQDLIDKLNLVSREILTGMPVIRAFNTQKREEDRFDVANKDLMKNSVFVNNTMSIMMPALMLIMNAITILIVWVGAKNIDAGTMQVGDMMAFIQYTMQIVISFLFIAILSIILPRAAVSARRINEVLDASSMIKDKPESQQKEFDENKKGYVEFRNVSFKYPDADSEVLTNIDFVAKPNETTAIIGSTGSGKSTVVNLIPRFYDVTSGELLVDGVNVKDVSQHKLRQRIGFVPQKGVLFSGTIESNIKYGKPSMNDSDMIKAAQISQSEEFIQNKEEKYNSEIAQGGNNVSGGQKQRLSIARALAIEPEIIVFDDSFSALDLKTDSKLREALAKETTGKTVIIVAQRISTIMNAEQIIVLEEGKIVGKGTHEELMQNCETYKQIALSQLSEKELENSGREDK